MTNNFKNITRFFSYALAAVFFLLTSISVAAPSKEKFNVLVLNSYNPNYSWTEEVTDSIQKTLDEFPGNIELSIEYLDFRRIRDPRHIQNLKKLLVYKSQTLSYDVIIAVDSEAVNFLINNHQVLHPHTPVVFCGVSESQAQNWQKLGYVTGIIESYDYEPIVRTALKLHPRAKHMFVIKDAKSPSNANEKNLEQTMKLFSDQIEFLTFKPLQNNAQELLRIIGGLTDDTIVLITSRLYASDPNHSFSDHAEEIKKRCQAPIYVVKKNWFGIGHVVGGNIGSGALHGQKAAQMAIEILQGKNPSDIPFVKQTPSQLLFDYKQLKYFQLDQALLPPQSVIIKKPQSFYYLYKKIIWSTVSIIVALSLTVMVLVINALRRKRAEIALEQRLRYEEALAATSRVLLTDSPNEHTFNQALQQLLKVADVNRAYIFKNYQCPNGSGLCTSQIYEACAPHVWSKMNNQLLKELSYNTGFERWKNQLSKEKPIVGIVDDSFPPEERKLLESQGVKSVLIFPIIIDENWYGFIGFDDIAKPRKWKPQDISLLRTGAEVISSYIERQLAAQALRESEERYKSLFLSAAEGILVVDVETMKIKYSNPAFCEMLGYSEQELKSMTIPDIHPQENRTEILEEFKAHSTGKKKIGTNIPCLKKDKSVIYVDITTATETIDNRKCNVGFFTDVTIRRKADEALKNAHQQLEQKVQERTLALAGANKELRNEIRERQKAESKLLVYHDQLRSMSSKLALAEERLRRKMAIDIHDNLGQDLAMAKMKIEDIASSDCTLKNELDQVSQLLANTIQSTRSLTFELSPPILYELGFEAALKWLVRQANDQYAFSAKFSNDDLPKPLENDVRVILFQAVKEVLFNVAKHAKAKKVFISTEKQDHQIKIKIKDDGTGFDVSQTLANEQGKSGYGLFSVRERMDYIGGRILINSKPDKGTRIILFAPLQNDNNQVDGKLTNEHKNSIS